jgi:hypothetical protein
LTGFQETVKGKEAQFFFFFFIKKKLFPYFGPKNTTTQPGAVLILGLLGIGFFELPSENQMFKNFSFIFFSFIINQ